MVSIILNSKLYFLTEEEFEEFRLKCQEIEYLTKKHSIPFRQELKTYDLLKRYIVAKKRHYSFSNCKFPEFSVPSMLFE